MHHVVCNYLQQSANWKTLAITQSKQYPSAIEVKCCMVQQLLRGQTQSFFRYFVQTLERLQKASAFSAILSIQI